MCEGRAQVVGGILQCVDCLHTACANCAGRPEHNYAPFVEVDENEILHEKEKKNGKEKSATEDKKVRVSPHDFMEEFSRVLPMCVALGGLSEDELESLKPESVKPALWKKWV